MCDLFVVVFLVFFTKRVKWSSCALQCGTRNFVHFRSYRHPKSTKIGLNLTPAKSTTIPWSSEESLDMNFCCQINRAVKYFNKYCSVYKYEYNEVRLKQPIRVGVVNFKILPHHLRQHSNIYCFGDISALMNLFCQNSIQMKIITTK